MRREKTMRTNSWSTRAGVNPLKRKVKRRMRGSLALSAKGRQAASSKRRELTPYEQGALVEINNWKASRTGLIVSTLQVVAWPLAKAGDLIMKIPYLGEAIRSAIQGIVSILSDAAHWSIRPQAIFIEYRKDGAHVEKLSDIAALDLQDIDRAIGWLGAKYKGIAFSEGGAAGATGLPGMIVDIPTLVALNLRAIGEYSTYCGYDISLQHERVYAMNILKLASSPDERNKTIALAELAGLSIDIAKKKTWKELNKNAFIALVGQIAKGLGIRITKAKLAQVVPVTGALVGAGFNAYYTACVCDAAYYLYRERLLIEKYGVELIKRSERQDHQKGLAKR
jgi:hypothetical protein